MKIIDPVDRLTSARAGRRFGHRIRRSSMAGAMFICAAALTGGTGALAHGPESIPDLAERLLDAVVNISTATILSEAGDNPPGLIPQESPFDEFLEDLLPPKQEPLDGPSQKQARALGSGFVIDAAEGLIVTNNHVVEGADAVSIILNDGRELTGQIVGVDARTDIALLQIDRPENLESVEFGDSEQVRVGDWVMAIGNPFGQSGTVTTGIVSARNRNISAHTYGSFIQTDAAISRGNSGGPLFNADGEVIGVNTAIISPTGGSIGIGFAMPSNVAARIVRQLRDFGETRRGWLGVRIQYVTEKLAHGLGLARPRGALITGVTTGGPAEKAGFRVGDLVLSFDGMQIGRMQDLPVLVANAEVGRMVEVLISRDGAQMRLSARLGLLDESEQPQNVAAPPPLDEILSEAGSALGLHMSKLTSQARGRFGIARDVQGVLIVKVDDDSPAASLQLETGEVIVEVARRAVAAPADVADEIAGLKTAGRNIALLLISTPAGQLRFEALEISDAASGDD